MLLILGPTVACAQEGIDDFASYQKMEDSGWDLKSIDKQTRLVLSEEPCQKKLDYIKDYNWLVQGWSNSAISTTFWGRGRAKLTFGNCNNEGEVSVLLDGKEIKKSKPNGEKTTVSFDMKEGSNLTITTDNRSIIKLIRLKLKCGASGKIISYFTF